MKRISIIITTLILSVGILVFAGVVWWSDNTGPVSNNEEIRRFVITKGLSAEEIGDKLHDAGLIKSPLAFKVYVQFSGKQKSINAGQFDLSESMSLPEIVSEFAKAPSQVWVTIPEGLRREEVVERFVDSLGIEGQRATAFREQFLLLTEDMEGYLFPDTYLLPPETTAEKAVNLMRSTFDQKFDEAIRADIVNTGLTLDEVVILASILEKETKTDDERPVVAGIYFNRLDIGQALQADATAQYANGSARCRNVVEDCDWWVTPTRADLQIDSPYNTYKYSDLPPSPIANPGLSSLRAVVYSETTPYYYYIHDENGQIHYASSFEEHNRNVQEHLR